MAKIAFSKLGLKEKKDIKTVNVNDIQFEVKQYIPISEKLDLIVRVINTAQDENNFYNPMKVDMLFALEIVFTYTNISFTEKQKEDLAKLYDVLDSNGIIDMVIEAIPQGEYNFVIDSLDKTIKNIYSYKSSVLGILETISQDYSNLKLDAETIRKNLGDPDNMTFLKDVLTKLG